MSHPNDNLVVQKPLITSKPWWQKRAFTIGVAVLGLLLIIIIMTINVAKLEAHLASGDMVLLELAPVDPRGFMQGDYMALSYALERDVFDALRPKSAASELEADEFEQDFRSYEPGEGYVIVRLDKHKVGRFVSLADNNNRNGLAANELPIHYRIRNGNILLATNTFFFQEGHAEAFEAAEYGLFRVNDKGEPLLTDMVNEKFEVIKGISTNDENSKNIGRQGSGM